MGWSAFSFQADGLLRLKLSAHEYKEFAPGTIFGFKTDGIKYIYNSSTKKYLAVLSESKMLNFFVGETEKNVYKGIVVDDSFFYSTRLEGDIKAFNKENIFQDFESPKLRETLMDLESNLKRKELDVDMHLRQFNKAKKIVEEHLEELAR